MGSLPRPSDDSAAPTSSGSALRALPRVATVREAWFHPGSTAAASIGFATRVGLSQVSRWSLDMSTRRVEGGQAVRPPLAYLHAAGHADSETDGDARVTPPPSRGLRRSLSAKSPGSPGADGPGRLVAALRPELIDPSSIGASSSRGSSPSADPGSRMDAFKRMLQQTGRMDEDGVLADGEPSASVHRAARVMDRTASPGADVRSATARSSAGQRGVRERSAPADVITGAPGRRPMDGSASQPVGGRHEPPRERPDLPGVARSDAVHRRVVDDSRRGGAAGSAAIGGPEAAVSARSAVAPMRAPGPQRPAGDVPAPERPAGHVPGRRDTSDHGARPGERADSRPVRERSSAELLGSSSSTVGEPIVAPTAASPNIGTRSPASSTVPSPSLRPRTPDSRAGVAAAVLREVAPPAAAAGQSSDTPSELRTSMSASISPPVASSEPPAESAVRRADVAGVDPRRSVEPLRRAVVSASASDRSASDRSAHERTAHERTASEPTARERTAHERTVGHIVRAPDLPTGPSGGAPDQGAAGRGGSTAVLAPARRADASPSAVTVEAPTDLVPSQPSVAPRPTPGRTAAEAFSEVLRSAPSVAARPLPDALRPLAAAIVGHSVVTMRTDHVARRALNAAGKRAATTGTVIHLARTPDPIVDRALIAHELTHVAHPSTAPRFFDDVPSVEERRADEIAALVQRLPTSAWSASHPVRRRRTEPARTVGGDRADSIGSPAGSRDRNPYSSRDRGASGEPLLRRAFRPGVNPPQVPTVMAVQPPPPFGSARTAARSEGSPARSVTAGRSAPAITPLSAADLVRRMTSPSAAVEPARDRGSDGVGSGMAPRPHAHPAAPVTREGPVQAPTAAPGIRPSSSSRLAVAPAAVIRRSPALSSGFSTGQSTRQVATAGGHATSSAGAVAGSPRAASDDVVRRLAIGSHRARAEQATAQPAAQLAAMPGPTRAATPAIAAAASTEVADSPDPLTAAIADLRSASGVVDFVDWIVDQIEDRLLSELQRRGGRFRGDF